MGGPVVYVDVSEVDAERRGELREALDELTELVERKVPQLLSYTVYFDGDRMTVIHVHPDAASLEVLMDEAGPLFGGFADLLRLRSIDVYGAIGAQLEDRVKQKAEMLGGGDVRVHELANGFVRTP